MKHVTSGHRLRLGSLLLLTVVVRVGPSAAQVPTRADSAEALFGEGLRAFRAGSKQSLERAIGLWARVVALNRAVGDRRSEALTLNSMGEVHGRLGRPDSALAYYAQALAIRREVGERTGEGTTRRPDASAVPEIEDFTDTGSLDGLRRYINARLVERPRIYLHSQ